MRLAAMTLEARLEGLYRSTKLTLAMHKAPLSPCHRYVVENITMVCTDPDIRHIAEQITWAAWPWFRVARRTDRVNMGMLVAVAPCGVRTMSAPAAQSTMQSKLSLFQSPHLRLSSRALGVSLLGTFMMVCAWWSTTRQAGPFLTHSTPLRDALQTLAHQAHIGGKGLQNTSSTEMATGLIDPIERARALQDEADFRSQCIDAIKRQDYPSALSGCARFADHRIWSAKAHAALAAVYSGAYYGDIPAATEHAKQAQQMGDPHGKMLAAMLNLYGKSNEPVMDLARLITWVKEAEDAHVFAADVLANKLAHSQACRANAGSFRLLGEPMFCLLGLELDQHLNARGMRTLSAYSDDWQMSWSPGPMYAISSRADALFDQASDGIPVLAAFIYNARSTERERILKALTEKYGKPQAVAGHSDKGPVPSWSVGQGVRLQVLTNEHSGVEVRYELPVRMESRASHLQQQRELRAQMQTRRDETTF
jgi:hypothetical protein